jgi:hypothetical protein
LRHAEWRRAAAGACALLLFAAVAAAQAPVLPSWNDGAAKTRIVEFVKAVTDSKGKDYVAPADRIAVFDNDGTLWCEQPLYVQFVFMLELLATANSGMTVGEYDQAIREWLKTARHPKYQRPYTELVYEPMQELLGYLKANGFQNFIVSGGSVEFMRPWAEEAYGIPPERIVGSQQDVKFEMKDGKPVLTRAPKFDFIDDGPGKPVGIYRHVGKRPIAAFGNSDGDLQMLQVTTAGEGRRLGVIVHHDDGERETAYDRESHIGKLDKALDAAGPDQWIVISMKSDWKKVFAFEK